MSASSVDFPVKMNGRPLRVGVPETGDFAEFQRLVGGVFDRRWFTNGGELVRSLEEKLERYLEVKHCLLVCNGTFGLQLACRVLGLKGEVIVPSFTFVATAHALEWMGLEPVFAEVDPRTHNLDAASVRGLVTERTRAILGVHLWGRPCLPGELQAVADEYGLALLFDAAHAIGVRHGGVPLGNFGRCEVFSLHATKCLHTFEGGLVTTNDAALAGEMRRLMNFGLDGAGNCRGPGVNGKLSEIGAAMGHATLAALPGVLETNRAHHRRYREGLAGIPGLRVMDYGDVESPNCQYVVVEVDGTRTGVGRDALWEHLRERQIHARRYFDPPCHRLPPYTARGGSLPVTEALARRVLALPTGSAVGAEDVDRVIEEIRKGTA